VFLGPGWAHFTKKVRGPWHRGAGFNLPMMYFFVLYLHKKVKGIAKGIQGSFNLRQKPSQKHQT
jgi:hypothetical protein